MLKIIKAEGGQSTRENLSRAPSVPMHTYAFIYTILCLVFVHDTDTSVCEARATELRQRPACSINQATLLSVS